MAVVGLLLIDLGVVDVGVDLMGVDLDFEGVEMEEAILMGVDSNFGTVFSP